MQIAKTNKGEIEYRVEGNGSKVALVLHGGHMNANIRLGEDYFIENGYTVITVSRPGYGNTPLDSVASPDDFAELLKELLDQLGIDKVIAVGISAGGRTVMRLAAKYPELIEKLILQSATSFVPWPDLKTRIAAHIAFNSFSEKYTWKLMRRFLKKNPKAAIKLMISNMTTLDPDKVMADYTPEQLKGLEEVFAASSSGKGFMNDIRSTGGDATDVTVPTLIIHSKYDKTVPIDHPQRLAQEIKDAQLYLSEAESHMIWFSSHYSEIKLAMKEFLERSST